jgi:hypothetical protein
MTRSQSLCFARLLAALGCILVLAGAGVARAEGEGFFCVYSHTYSRCLEGTFPPLSGPLPLVMPLVVGPPGSLTGVIARGEIYPGEIHTFIRADYSAHFNHYLLAELVLDDVVFTPPPGWSGGPIYPILNMEYDGVFGGSGNALNELIMNLHASPNVGGGGDVVPILASGLTEPLGPVSGTMQKLVAIQHFNTPITFRIRIKARINGQTYGQFVDMTARFPQGSPVFTGLPAGTQVNSACGHIVDNMWFGTEEPTPIADAGPDQTLDEFDGIVLDGSASSDPLGELLTYQWDQVAGPTVALDLTDPVHPTFDAPSVEVGGATATFQLIVSAGQRQSEPDSVDIVIKNVNHPPVAVAGDDQAVLEGSSVSLDGSGSYDPDAESLTYAWAQIAGTPVVLSADTAVGPSFDAPFVGPEGETLTFELRVHDGIDESLPDTVDILVENVNHAPLADAGPDQTTDEETPVALDGGGSSDPDGDPLSVTWTQISGTPVVLSSPTSVATGFTAPTTTTGGETLVFELRVDDGFGDSDVDQVTIRVLDTNDPPLCGAAAPTEGVLWPPNHKFTSVGITGVSDPNDDAVEITVISVTQDEPTEGLGDGDTSPDAVAQDSTVLIRCERSGLGNGRVYVIGFTADDGEGGTCSGNVTVCVPHDRKKPITCVNDGQLFDSLQAE